MKKLNSKNWISLSILLADAAKRMSFQMMKLRETLNLLQIKLLNSKERKKGKIKQQIIE